MAWVTISCQDGPYEIDVDGVTRLIRSYSYAKALSDNSEIETESHIIGPDLESVKTDWDKVLKQRDGIASQTTTDFYLKMSTGLSGKAGIEYLEGLIDDRDDYTDMVREKQTNAGKHTMNNIEHSVKLGEAGETVFTVIRDACAETELVLATGGAAAFGLEAGAMAGTIGGISIGQGAASAGAITVGSLMKGGFKWQDTMSFGQGVAEASIELVVNFLTFGIGGQIPRGVGGERTARLVVGLVFGGEMKGALKMMPAGYVSPDDVAKGREKSPGELLIPAAANIPSGIARQLVEGLLKDPKWAVPATVVLKLALRYGAAAIAKPAKVATAAVGRGSGIAAQRGVLRDLAAMGRTSLSCTISDGFVDCSKPEEDFVLNSALRPLFSQSKASSRGGLNGAA
jgi:hypothetical protein